VFVIPVVEQRCDIEGVVSLFAVQTQRLLYGDTVLGLLDVPE
jgi:hypothetical protein